VPFIVSAIIMATVSVLLQFIIYTCLYIKEKQQYFKMWAISWGFYLLRQILEILSNFIKSSDVLLICLQLSSLFSGLFLLWGAHRFTGQKVAREWVVIGGMAVLSTFINPFLKLSFPWITLLTFLFLGVIYIWTGIIFLRSIDISGAGKHLTGWGLIIWGIHKANYPLLRPVEWMAELGFLLVFVLGFIVAIGTILVYFEKARTERKLGEEELRKLSHAVEQSPIMIVITDKNGNIEYVNPRFAQNMGYNPAEVIGKHWSMLGGNGPYSKEPLEFIKIIPTGKEWRGEMLSSKKDGEVFWEMSTVSPIRDRNGEITHYIKLGEDITYRKREEQELQKAKAEAEAANRSKSQFLANISHEIRTAMNCINGMTELLFTTEIAPAQKEYLELIKSSSASLLNLINDILDLARIEAGKLRLEQNNFDMVALYRQIVKSYQLQAQQKDLQFDSFIAPEVPANLTGDPGRLRQVLENLLGNAIKFTDKGAVSLRIEVQKESSIAIHILFVVSDTGIGINPDKIDLLFKNFSRVDDVSNPSKYSGSGLGLAICKQLVELMNGRIWVESQAGLGSKFSFMVPFLKSKIGAALGSARNQPSDFPEGKPEDIGGKIKVLVVEDHPVNQRFVLLVLQKIGGEVTLASSGVKALEVLETEKFDLILMDVQMPEMDGYETTIRIREKERLTNTHTPIIALTAYAMGGDKEKCLTAGMDGYLSKPINAAKLSSLVTHTLKNKLYQNRLSQPPPIDLTATLRIVDGDFKLVRELVSSFKNDCPQRLAELVKTHQEGDLGKLMHLAHRLKGALSYFGAEKALLLIGKLEQSGKSKQVEATAAVLRDLETELGRIIDFINQFERGNVDEGFNC
jgi:PAS domain S-box-containing protein